MRNKSPANTLRLWLSSRSEQLTSVWNHRVDRRVSLLTGSILLVVGIGQITESWHIDADFYALVAQMIPVLMLVAAVEGRYFRERENDGSFDRFVLRGFWFGGLLGVAASLAVVARGHDSALLRGTVFYSLALVGILISVFALYGPAQHASEERG